MVIKYIIGDSTRPQADGAKIIVHVCNDIGAWGKGFVLAISKRWAEPEKSYRRWYEGKENVPFVLGQVQFVKVEDDIWIANLIGQHDIRKGGSIPPVRYDAIRQGLSCIAVKAKEISASIHMPRIGCGLAGGKWEEVSKIIENELISNGIEVTVYELP